MLFFSLGTKIYNNLDFILFYYLTGHQPHPVGPTYLKNEDCNSCSPCDSSSKEWLGVGNHTYFSSLFRACLSPVGTFPLPGRPCCLSHEFVWSFISQHELGNASRTRIRIFQALVSTFCAGLPGCPLGSDFTVWKDKHHLLKSHSLNCSLVSLYNEVTVGTPYPTRWNYGKSNSVYFLQSAILCGCLLSKIFPTYWLFTFGGSLAVLRSCLQDSQKPKKLISVVIPQYWVQECS